MIEHSNRCIEFWRHKADQYEWMFLEQRDIAIGYRQIIDDLKKTIKELELKK